MKPENYQYVLALLHSTKNAVLAEKLHLEHQYSIPPDHRVLEADDLELENSLIKVRLQYSQLKEAIDDFERNVIPKGKPDNNSPETVLY
jgi:hypothetical protein